MTLPLREPGALARRTRGSLEPMRLLPFALTTFASLGACGFTAEREPSPFDSPAMVDGDAPPADAAPTVPLLVQEQTRFATSGAQLTVTFPNAPADGNMLVMIGAANSGALTTVTGGGVASWARAASAASNANIEIWYGVTDGTQGTIAISRTGNGLAIWLSVTEWSGLATTSSLDKAVASSGTTTTASAGTITTTTERDLLFFAVADENAGLFGTPTQGPWSPLAALSGAAIRQAAWHRVVSATDSYAPAVSTSGANWDAAVVALRIAP